MTIQNLISDEMDVQGMSIHKLSKLSGVDHGHLWRFKNGRGKRPGFETVIKLMRVLKIPMKKLDGITL